MMGLSDSEWEKLRTLQFEFNMRKYAPVQIDVIFTQEQFDIHNEKMKKIYNKMQEIVHNEERFYE